MNFYKASTRERTIDLPLTQGRININFKDLFQKAGIVLAGLILIFLLILLKSKTTSEFSVSPIFFSYAILVTTFTLSRIISSMLYKISLDNVLEEENNPGEKYMPSVAFVVPCMNEENDIENTIDKCYAVNYPKDKIEVIVVNDGSTDNTQIILDKLKIKYPNLRVISWENQGKRWAMAAGFRVSTSEIIVQLDSDSHVNSETFYNLIAPFKNERISAVCADGRPQNSDQNIITKMQTAYYFMSFRILKSAESTFETVFCLSGCCSAYRKKDVMPVIYDWLAESFLGKPVTWGDDRALTSWLLKKGKKTIYANKAIAYTIVPNSWKQLIRQQLRWKKSWIINAILTSRFIWKKQPFVAFFYYFPLVFISFLAPFMATYVLIYAPIVKGTLPFFHVIGVTLVTALIVLYYRYIDKNNKYWPYLFLWSLMSLFILSFMLFWAAIKIQDRGWGTR